MPTTTTLKLWRYFTYVAEDSSDMWANPHLFQNRWKRKSNLALRCPPDEFSATGQLWGNLNLWLPMDKDSYYWTLAWKLQDLHIVRIDHFRGFESYWGNPCWFWNCSTRHGSGPCYKLLKPWRKSSVIWTSSLRTWLYDGQLLSFAERTGFPVHFTPPSILAMKVSISPTWHQTNSVMYTGTHDHKSGCPQWNRRSNSRVSCSYQPDESVPHAMLRTVFLLPSAFLWRLLRCKIFCLS